MYPYLRFIKILITARFKSRLPYNGKSTVRFLVWPWDADIYPEMNNGRHLTLMDLGRFDLSIRTGLWQVVRKNKWGLVVAGASVRYRRKLRPFDLFSIESQCVGYDQKWFYFYQETIKKGVKCSSALIRGAMLDENGLIESKKALAAMGVKEWQSQVPAWVKAWIEADKLRPVM